MPDQSAIEAVNQYFTEAARAIDLDDDLYGILTTSYREVAVQVPVRLDDGDLMVARGVWARAFIRVGIENHGGSKRLFRLRCALRPSWIGKAVLGGCAILAALGIVTSTPAASAAAAAAAAVCLGVVIYQNHQLGRILHQVAEITAHRLGLVRVDGEAPRRIAEKAVAPAE